MTTVEYLLLALIVGTCLASFALGYEASNREERRAAKFLRHIRSSLRVWIEENWHTEQKAFQTGHKIGYQQGIYQAKQLEEDAEIEELQGLS